MAIWVGFSIKNVCTGLECPKLPYEITELQENMGQDDRSKAPY